MTFWRDIKLTVSHSRRSLLSLLWLVPVLYLVSGFYLVGAEQRAIVTRLGKIVNDEVLPGLHYRLPWPIDDVVLLRVTELRSLAVDFAHENQAAYLQTEVTTHAGDLVNARVDVQFSVKDAGQYYHSSLDPEMLLKNAIKAETISYFLTQPFEPLLTTGRAEAQRILRNRLEINTEKLGLGMTIHSVTIQRLAPPNSAKRAFDRAQAAPAEKLQLIEEALAERDTALISVRSQVNQLKQHFAASSEEILLAAQGSKEQYESIVSGLQMAPEINIERYYRETLEQILSGSQLTLVDVRQQ